MMAAFTASRHFTATLGAPRPRRSERNGNCKSHTRDVFHSLLPSRCGCVHQFAARGSRTSPAPDAWLRAHKNAGSGGFFTDSCAHDHHRQHTVGQTMQTVRTKCRNLSHDKRDRLGRRRNQLILPVFMCENRSRRTCSGFHRLHSESNLACVCGLWGSKRSSRAAYSPFPTRCQNTPRQLSRVGVGCPTRCQKKGLADTAPAESP